MAIATKIIAQMMAGIWVDFLRLVASPALEELFIAIINNSKAEMLDSASTIKLKNNKNKKVLISESK